MGNINEKIPDNFNSHFNEMKQLLDQIETKGLTGEEFIEKAKEIGIKHFGHSGIMLTQEVIDGEIATKSNIL